jgi:hypothetical protein
MAPSLLTKKTDTLLVWACKPYIRLKLPLTAVIELHAHLDKHNLHALDFWQQHVNVLHCNTSAQLCGVGLCSALT